tara:strand:- start:12122 stop:12781 length:660 start_codon:yes stop_codon:yes gene_type:complete
MSHGIVEFSTNELQFNSNQLGLNGKEGITYQAKTTKKFKGDVLGLDVSMRKGSVVAVKTFKPKKSTAKIMREATFQQACAQTGASPQVLGVNLEEKYIVMQKLDSLPVDTYREKDLPDDLQYKLCALMVRMDTAGVLHSDMNPRNVMLDKKGRPWIIDFGFGKKIDNKVKKKHGDQPNISVTLWGLVRGFERSKVGCQIMRDCVDNPVEYIEHGEQLLH